MKRHVSIAGGGEGEGAREGGEEGESMGDCAVGC